MKKILAAVVALLVCAGCGTLTSSVGLKIGRPKAADLGVVSALVCRGDIVGAQGVLAARGYDFATSTEAIERAKMSCPAVPPCEPTKECK